MDNYSSSQTVIVLSAPAAAIKPRPLLLTGTQGLVGLVLRHLGAGLLLALTSTSIVSVLLIFVFVVREAVPFLTQYDLLHLLGSSQWYPQADPPRFGMLALAAGSAYVTVTSLLIAVPVGVTAAVFISEMASQRLRAWIKPIIEVLAAIPSVAYGFFAIKVMAPWMQEGLGFHSGANALNSSLVLAVMAMPTIISVSEDAISALGRDLREAAYGLGSTRTETILKVLIPAARTGILAALILGMMRAIGETMVVWMASGNASQIPQPWWDLSQSIRTITATIAGEMGETAKGTLQYRALFALGTLLLLVTSALNLASELLVSRGSRRQRP